MGEESLGLCGEFGERESGVGRSSGAACRKSGKGRIEVGSWVEGGG